MPGRSANTDSAEALIVAVWQKISKRWVLLGVAAVLAVTLLARRRTRPL
jgi:hypothetical protein